MLRKNRLFRWFLLLAFWTLVGLAFATQLHVYTSRAKMPMTWANAMTWELSRWCLWAFLSPIIFYLYRKYPITQERKIQRIAFHLAASLGVSFLHLILFFLLYWTQTQILQNLSFQKSIEETLFTTLPELFRKHSATWIPILHGCFTLTFHVSVLVYWGILLAYQGMESARRASQLETQLALAQLGALKMQLQPHFLFNTLNSISALLHQDPEAADEMIGELGSFLRLTLKNPGAQEVSLAEELKFLKSYLEIERVRLQDRLTANFKVEEESLDARLPNLILQPIIENAIRYAVAPRTDPGRIDIHARRKNGRLEIDILDDGPGLKNEERDASQDGIGLSNTRARLQRMYGPHHEFRLENRPEGGLAVHIEIPYKTTDEPLNQKDLP
jgi:hypothetical protein